MAVFVKRAIVSVFNKEGLESLAAAMKELKISVISTGLLILNAAVL